MVVLTSFQAPQDGIKHRQPDTIAFIGNKAMGKGSLYIAENRVLWVDDTTGQGFSLDYPNIALHAVSRDPAAFVHDCLYLMLDIKLDESDAKSDKEDSDEDDEESESQMTEVRFVPDDKGVIDAMYNAMTTCQALHPDPNDSLSDDGGFEDAQEGDEDEEEGENGEDYPGDTDDMEVGQFEDAEPDH